MFAIYEDSDYLNGYDNVNHIAIVDALLLGERSVEEIVILGQSQAVFLVDVLVINCVEAVRDRHMVHGGVGLAVGQLNVERIGAARHAASRRIGPIGAVVVVIGQRVCTPSEIVTLAPNSAGAGWL